MAKLKELELEVRWMLGDTTWEPLAACKDLEALSSRFILRASGRSPSTQPAKAHIGRTDHVEVT